MKYSIEKEFFPFSHFTPPIGERFLAPAARIDYMKKAFRSPNVEKEGSARE